MNVNATLVIQAINFAIAYIVLRTFLFKPAIAVIQHEQEEQEAIKNVIGQQEQSIELKEKERQKHWQLCRSYFVKNRPPVDVPSLYIFKGLTPEVEPYQVKDEVIAGLIADTTKSLEDKIGRIHE